MDTGRDPTALESQLIEARERFRAFVAARIADPELAEDVLQDALLRAVEALPSLRDDERVVPWFYRILRNAIVDAYRRRDVERRHIERPDDVFDVPDTAGDEDDRALCECFRALIPTLKPEYAEVIERLDLGGEPTTEVAERLGVTANNLKVRRHRARQALRARLDETCRTCATHGCLDCTCPAAPSLDSRATTEASAGKV